MKTRWLDRILSPARLPIGEGFHHVHRHAGRIEARGAGSAFGLIRPAIRDTKKPAQ
jgi:hypothetical protein